MHVAVVLRSKIVATMSVSCELSSMATSRHDLSSLVGAAEATNQPETACRNMQVLSFWSAVVGGSSDNERSCSRRRRRDPTERGEEAVDAISVRGLCGRRATGASARAAVSDRAHPSF